MTATPEQLRMVAATLRAEPWDSDVISERLQDAIRPLDYRHKVTCELLRDHGNEAMFLAVALALELEALRSELATKNHGYEHGINACPICDRQIAAVVRRHWGGD